jgi:tripartite-type tricarboxylate transporter receptor subunit TctC
LLSLRFARQPRLKNCGMTTAALDPLKEFFMFMRRTLLKPLAVLVAGIGAYTAQAGPFPSQPITLIVPYAAGGTTDILGRALAEHMSRTLQQSVIVDNRPGANGTMGVLRLKQVKPDGHTLTMVPLGVFRQPYLETVRYDPIKDLTYVSMVAGYNYAIAVRADSAVNSIQQLIENSKNDKSGVFYGISALYSVNQALMTQLASVTGARWTAVPFKGDAESINALLGGQVQAISATNGILPFVTSGKVRVLATAGTRRPKDFKDAPTLLEAGYKISVSSPLGIAGPAGMPPDVVAAIDKAVRTAVQDPAFQTAADRYGISLEYQNSATYTEYARKTAVAEKDIVKLMKGEQP